MWLSIEQLGQQADQSLEARRGSQEWTEVAVFGQAAERSHRWRTEEIGNVLEVRQTT